MLIMKTTSNWSIATEDAYTESENKYQEKLSFITNINPFQPHALFLYPWKLWKPKVLREYRNGALEQNGLKPPNEAHPHSH